MLPRIGTARRRSKVTRLPNSGPSFCSGASFRSLLPSGSVVTKWRATDTVVSRVPATSITAPSPMVMRAPGSLRPALRAVSGSAL